MSLIDERSTIILRRVIESEYSARSGRAGFLSSMDAATPNVDQENFKKLQDGYNACMDEDLIAQRGLQPMLRFVQEIRDIFPATRSSGRKGKGSTVNITNAITYLQELGLAGFIDFGISVRTDYPS